MEIGQDFFHDKSRQRYMKILPQIREILSFAKFSEYSAEVQDAFIKEFSRQQPLSEYMSLNQKIRTFISEDVYNKMPLDVKKFLQKAKGNDLKDAQLLYLSKIPWGIYQVKTKSISDAKDILNQTHSGMTQVKERILRYIACQKRIGENYGSVLLLVGPPGVGKTSITTAVADAMGRNFTKISLAGAADADFLRGTSSIYSDSKPGMIIESIIRAESFTPLILLDEIDKMGASTQHGSPEHALLHILDSDRKLFVDDFLSIPVDLSQVIFIATANSTNNLSPILLNRLEIIKLSGYSKKDKLDILYKHVIPRLQSEYLLSEQEVTLSQKTAEYIIDNFTNEPGIRSLEQLIRNIFESIVFYIESGTPYSTSLTIGDVSSILGVSTPNRPKKTRKAIRKSDRLIKKRDDLFV